MESYLAAFKEPWYQSGQVRLNVECPFFIAIFTYLFIWTYMLNFLG